MRIFKNIPAEKIGNFILTVITAFVSTLLHAELHRLGYSLRFTDENCYYVIMSFLVNLS